MPAVDPDLELRQAAVTQARRLAALYRGGLRTDRIPFGWRRDSSAS